MISTPHQFFDEEILARFAKSKQEQGFSIVATAPTLSDMEHLHRVLSEHVEVVEVVSIDALTERAATFASPTLVVIGGHVDPAAEHDPAIQEALARLRQRAESCANEVKFVSAPSAKQYSITLSRAGSD